MASRSSGRDPGPVPPPEIRWAQDDYNVHVRFVIPRATECQTHVVDRRRLVFSCCGGAVVYRAAFTLEHDVEESDKCTATVADKHVSIVLHKTRLRHEWGRLGDTKACGLSASYDWDLERALEVQNAALGIDALDDVGSDDDDYRSHHTPGSGEGGGSAGHLRSMVTAGPDVAGGGGMNVSERVTGHGALHQGTTRQRQVAKPVPSSWRKKAAASVLLSVLWYIVGLVSGM